MAGEVMEQRYNDWVESLRGTRTYNDIARQAGAYGIPVDRVLRDIWNVGGGKDSKAGRNAIRAVERKYGLHDISGAGLTDRGLARSVGKARLGNGSSATRANTGAASKPVGAAAYGAPSTELADPSRYSERVQFKTAPKPVAPKKAPATTAATTAAPTDGGQATPSEETATTIPEVPSNREADLFNQLRSAYKEFDKQFKANETGAQRWARETKDGLKNLPVIGGLAHTLAGTENDYDGQMKKLFARFGVDYDKAMANPDFMDALTSTKPDTYSQAFAPFIDVEAGNKAVYDSMLERKERERREKAQAEQVANEQQLIQYLAENPSDSRMQLASRLLQDRKEHPFLSKFKSYESYGLPSVSTATPQGQALWDKVSGSIQSGNVEKIASLIDKDTADKILAQEAAANSVSVPVERDPTGDYRIAQPGDVAPVAPVAPAGMWRGLPTYAKEWYDAATGSSPSDAELRYNAAAGTDLDDMDIRYRANGGR